MRVNIIESLQGFLASEHKLKKLRNKIVGMLPWYVCHDPLLSYNCRRFASSNAMGALSFEPEEEEKDEGDTKYSATKHSSDSLLSNGVTLMDGKSGWCAGTIRLPTNSLWSLVITISTQGRGPEYANKHSSDSIIVRIGPTMSSLLKVGLYTL